MKTHKNHSLVIAIANIENGGCKYRLQTVVKDCTMAISGNSLRELIRNGYKTMDVKEVSVKTFVITKMHKGE